MNHRLTCACNHGTSATVSSFRVLSSRRSVAEARTLDDFGSGDRELSMSLSNCSLALAGIAALASAGCEAWPSRGTVSKVPDHGVTVRLVSRVFPAVDGSLGPEWTEPFVLDTGASCYALSSRHANDQALSAHQAREVIAENGSFQLIRIDRFLVGSLSISKLDFVILDVPRFSGLLGVPFFSVVPVLFDGPSGEVVFLSNDSVEEVLRSRYPFRSWKQLKLTWTELVPSVDLVVGDQHLRMFVDTGSGDCTLSCAACQRLGLQELRKEDMIALDIAGEHPAKESVYLLKGLEVGSWKADLEVCSGNDSIAEEAKLDGTLGFDVLSRFPFVFDVRQGSIWRIDPIDSNQSTLQMTMDDSRRAMFHDPLNLIRLFAVESAARLGGREWLPEVGSMLEDVDLDVRSAAADAVSRLAGADWPSATRLEAARGWWGQHKDEPMRENHRQ